MVWVGGKIGFFCAVCIRGNGMFVYPQLQYQSDERGHFFGWYV
jgi:hypothetical protein